MPADATGLAEPRAAATMVAGERSWPGTPFALVLRRELRDSIRDWRITAPIAVLTAIFPWLMNVASILASNFAVSYGVADNAAVIMAQLVPFSLLIVGFFPISFSLVIALETFVGERERHTLEPLLATPISDRQLYLGKLSAAVLLPLAASYLGVIIHLATLYLSTDYRIDALPLVQILALINLEALAMVAGAVVISSHSTSVRAANLLASFIIIPMALLIQVEAALLFWRQYDAIWAVVVGLAVVDLALIRAGMGVFNREEILARDFDTFSLQRIWSRIRFYWSAPPGVIPSDSGKLAPVTLGGLYSQHLPGLLASYRGALGTSLLVMIGGTLLGAAVAGLFPLPSQFQLSGFSVADFARDWPELAFLPRLAIWDVFVHNIRALILGAAFAAISFGVIPLLLLLLPMGVVGFMAAQAPHLGASPTTFLAGFIMPHGIVELPAAWLATAFALQIGASLLAPHPGRTIGEAILLAAVNFAKVFLLLVLPLLFAAAALEVVVTPHVVVWLFGG